VQEYASISCTDGRKTTEYSYYGPYAFNALTLFVGWLSGRASGL